MNFYSNVRDIIIAILVSVLALVLFILLGAITFVFVLVQAVMRKDANKFATWFSKSFRITAEGIDMIANVVCRDLRNVWLIQKNGHPFGVRKETISSVLGKNLITGYYLCTWIDKQITMVYYNMKLKKRKKTIKIKLSIKKRSINSTLTKSGIALVNILDLIDPNHCQKSINDNL